MLSVVSKGVAVASVLPLPVINGLFTLAKFVSETVSDSDTQQSLLYLPWPPWVA